ncbi:MAG: HEPN domain-containing protein [Deltaproteobacteria bacterium]|nr:HEPN domain-containing protein [Deltaproteobacteria bacterium]
MPKETYKFLHKLTTYYIPTRYTDYTDKIFKTLNKETTKFVLTKTKEVFTWFLTLKQ